MHLKIKDIHINRLYNIAEIWASYIGHILSNILRNHNFVSEIWFKQKRTYFKITEWKISDDKFNIA